MGAAETTRVSLEEKHLELLRGGLAGCTVLLKRTGDLPLVAPGQIAAYGSGVRHTVKGGTGSGEVNSRYFINVEEGLRKAGFTVTTGKWLDAYDRVLAEAKKAFREEIRRRAKAKRTLAIIEGMGAVMPEPDYEIPLDGEGDTAIYVLARISGEGNDRGERGDILLTDTEIRDINRLREQYEHFLLVINAGGPVDLTPVLTVENILVLSQLGVETGSVLADILLGKAAPSGKLATTWHSMATFEAPGEFGCKEDTRYTEGIYVGYRYADTAGVKPLFPFGYGLTYTDFAIGFQGFRQEGADAVVCCRVTNTGARAGKETAQLYISVPAGRQDQPFQTLAAWAKTSELPPGASEDLELRFDLRELASYDEATASYYLEQGRCLMRLGSSSRDTVVVGSLLLEEEVTVLKTRNYLGKAGFEDLKLTCGTSTETDANVPEYRIDPEALVWTIPEAHVVIDKDIEKVLQEDLIRMNIGAFNPKGGVASIIGDAGMSVAGAAGESSQIFRKYQIPTLTMADGPAGLRLSQKYFVDKKGKLVSVGGTLPGSMAEFMQDFLPKIVVLGMKLRQKKPGRNDVVHEQYATAIPIGTAVAQSWDTAFAELCGDIVGREMEEFGVQLWLAPALNIHRDIRCGRNFEYFSEDPLISGKMAAAITRGVQNHPGCGVTLKHYAANNQETNRYNNNSAVSERAMREIYLRGFRIAITECCPAALMTSYNLLNGIHTSQNRGLLMGILRGELGYQGVVMTDWIVGGFALSKGAKYPAPNAADVAAAGGDLFMPGSNKEVREIETGLMEDRVLRKQLVENASRTAALAKRLNNDKRS
ncbi:MAG: glycoside hydrolase family 3 C-terminal domain-containing protein [Mogibacterium sp.]|nr:glycoside hydrolase family 3 C-terminal domain-containing protein [Mogibacterium sp.]